MKLITKNIILLMLVMVSHLMFPKQNNKASSEKPIVVVACSYNTSEWINNTLNSIFTQDYSNYRLILVDDCSTDGNQEAIRKYIADHNLIDRVTFIENSERKRKLFNLYRVLYECGDDEIVLMLDGDDWLAHPDVFSYINEIYEDNDIWFTYGQYRNEPASQAVLWGHKEMGYCRAVPKQIQKKHAYRYHSFIYMHLRTFRGWLFKMVKLEDLIADKVQGFEGDFYPASNDVAMYFPMVEMAHHHIKFISDILYIRNLYSDIVGFKVDRKIQVASAREIRKKACYPILFKPKKNRLIAYQNAQADVFVICRYNIDDIQRTLNNVKEKTSALGKIHVFFRDTEENKALCRKIKLVNNDVLFIPYSSTGPKSLRSRLLDSIVCSKNDHFVVTTDAFSIQEEVCFSDVIYLLEKTFAYRFYLNRDASNISTRYIMLDDYLSAWKFSSSVDGWHNINCVNDMLLCRKSDLLEEIKTSRFDSIYGLVSTLHRSDVNISHVGLFFNKAKVKTVY